jgi:hypothetical protein
MQQRSRRKLSAILVMALLVVMALPVMSFGKDRGRRFGRRNFDRSDWKCGRFVNCHDARHGRWDNRGPRRRWHDDRFGRRRVWDWDRNDFFFQNRRRSRDRVRDRDFDRDDFFRAWQRRNRWNR